MVNGHIFVNPKIYVCVIRHSPPGMPYGFVRIFIYFLFFRRQGFRMITFDHQARPLQNFNRSHVMVIGRSVSFSDLARPPGGGVGRPKHPKIPPSEKKCACVSEPQEHFLKKKISRENKIEIISPPPQIYIFFVCVLRPQEDVFAKQINFSY